MLGIQLLRCWWHGLWLPVPYKVQVPQLLAAAMALGLPAHDAANAQEYLKYAEWGLALEIIVEQLFEYAIPVTADFYEQVEACAESMEIAPDTYSFLLLLVKG